MIQKPSAPASDNNPAASGLAGVILDCAARFERKIAASAKRTRAVLRDGIYERGPKPTDSRVKWCYPLEFDHGKPEEEQTVWICVKPFQDLGFANGWRKSLNQTVAECRKKNHTLETREESRCVYRMTCAECGYFYYVDSTD